MAAYGNMDEALQGLIYGTENNIISRIAGVELAFGVAAFGPVGDGVKANLTQAGKLLGVTVRTDKRPGVYSVGDAANIMTSGHVWVQTAEAVEANTPAYLTPAGAWTDVATDNLATGYMFRSSVAAAGLAILEVIN